MKNKISAIKRITCVLGILFIMLGLLPVGVLGRVGEVFAGDGAIGSPCDKNKDCESNKCEDGVCVPPPSCQPEWTCPSDCDYPGGAVTDSCGGMQTCSATDPCTPPPCTPTFTLADCPTGCGLSASSHSDGCGGTVECQETEACPPPACIPTGEQCSDDAECCSGNYCAGNGKCKERSDDQCKGLNMPCGGANICCAGLVCATVAGSENEKCVPAPQDCVGEWVCNATECGTVGIATFEIITEAAYGGAECDFQAGATQECQGPPCPGDCVGSWGECDAECESTGVEIFTIELEAELGGEPCEAEDGDTRPCENTTPCDTSDDEDDSQGGGGTSITEIAGSIEAVIPVTGEEVLIIPVTGVDLGFDYAGLKQAFLFSGLMLFGMTLLLEGTSRKFRI